MSAPGTNVSGMAGQLRALGLDRWPVGLWRVLAGGLVISLLLVGLATRNALLMAGFAGGFVALCGPLVYLLCRTAPELAPDTAEPDWVVTMGAVEMAAGEQGDASAVAIVDRAGRLVCANRVWEKAFGLAPPPSLPLDEAAQAQLAALMRQVWREGEGRELDAAGEAIADRSGRLWQAEARCAGRAEDYQIWRMVPLAEENWHLDVARQLAGRAGRMLGEAGFAAALLNTQGCIEAANARFAARAGVASVADLAGADVVSLLAQDDQDQLFWASDNRRAVPLTLYYVPLVDPDGEAMRDPQVSPSLIVLVDAGAGMGGGAQGQAAPVHLEALLAHLPVGLAMADRDGRLLFANTAFMRAAGREGEAPPVYPTDLVVREDKAALSDAVRRFGQGAAMSGDLTLRLSAQAEETVSMSLAGVRGLGDAAVLLGLTDTTEEMRLKRQVAQATKMQAVGQLAGGVAHDFNNVLTAIIGTCDLMLLRHMPGDSDYDDIQQIRANSNRAASLTRQLLAFSRQQTLRPQVLQLPDIISEIAQMLRRLIGEKIQLIVTHDRDLGAVRADPTQLEQVIVNLVVNARDAMTEHGQRMGHDGGGKLTIATKRVRAADVRSLRSDIMPAVDYTALSVEDTGGGIPAEVIGKIWEPFFTTKEQGKGTGLGLSTVYGIVKQSGGFIFAENMPAAGGGVAGVRFMVYLPVDHGGEVAQKPTAPKLPSATWSGGGNVLLVEDEDAVRIVAERSLARAGYTVTTASDGEEGLQLLEERRESGQPMFDLVVSDVVMPIMDGPAMAREIRRLVPGLPLLFMSGYAEEQLRREIDIEDIHFIAKPFSVQQITEKVAGVLAAAAG